jgi:uncharacterized Zn finger protein (UPF0148 family)
MRSTALPAGFTRYDCPKCKKWYFRALDGKVVHCRACGGELVPQELSAPPKKENNLKDPL